MNQLQNKFNLQESADRLKVKIGNYSKLTVEIVDELNKAKEFYSNRGHRSDLVTDGTKLNSFNDFLEYIGLYKQKAYRWLERYIPEEHKLLTYEEFSEKKAAEVRTKLSEEERNRAIIAEYRKTGKKVSGWSSYHEERVKRDDAAFISQQQRINNLKQEQNKKSEESKATFDKAEKISTEARDTLKMAADIFSTKHKERESWKEKLRLSGDNKDSAFMDAIIDYMETLENDNRRIEACNNIIKICRNISVELQKA